MPKQVKWVVSPKYKLMGRLITINRNFWRWQSEDMPSGKLFAQNAERASSEWIAGRCSERVVMVIGYRHLNNGYTLYFEYNDAPPEWVTTSVVPALLVINRPRHKGYYIPRENYYVTS